MAGSVKDRITSTWYGSDLVDMLNRPFHIGDKFIKATNVGVLQLCQVSDIRNGKIYANNSRVPIQHPVRLLIVTEQFAITTKMLEVSHDGNNR